MSIRTLLVCDEETAIALTRLLEWVSTTSAELARESGQLSDEAARAAYEARRAEAERLRALIGPSGYDAIVAELARELASSGLLDDPNANQGTALELVRSNPLAFGLALAHSEVARACLGLEISTRREPLLGDNVVALLEEAASYGLTIDALARLRRRGTENPI